MAKLESWITSEHLRVENERKEAFAEKGFKEFWKFPQGTTTIKVDVKVKPRRTKDDKPILRAIINGEEWDVPMGVVMYAQVLKGLADGKTVFDIIRVGTDRSSTRYAVNAVE